MYWGVFTLIIVPFSHSKVCTNFQKNSHSFYSICIAHKFHIENTTYFLHKRMTFLGFYFGLTIFAPAQSGQTRKYIYSQAMGNTFCEFFKKRMCPGTFSRLRRSLATSTLYAAVRILAERFLLYRKAISCKVKKDSHRSAALLRRRYFYYGVQ